MTQRTVAAPYSTCPSQAQCPNRKHLHILFVYFGFFLWMARNLFLISFGGRFLHSLMLSLSLLSDVTSNLPFGLPSAIALIASSTVRPSTFGMAFCFSNKSISLSVKLSYTVAIAVVNFFVMSFSSSLSVRSMTQLTSILQEHVVDGYGQSVWTVLSSICDDSTVVDM